MNELGLALVGRRCAAALERRRFPLLVKLLDAHERLSVQVHPPDDYARRREAGEPGKCELWYFLRVQPGAQIIYGLRAGVARRRFGEALAAGALTSCLHYVPVRAGDVALVPPGALHALLGGVLVVEIQQTSDLTYRVYDWDRVDAEGCRRPLHVEKALDVIDFDLIEPALSVPRLIETRAGLRRESISECAAFSVERIEMEAGAHFAGECNGEHFEIWGCVAGGYRLSWAGGVWEWPAVHFVLLPALLGAYCIEATEPATLLRAWAG